MLVVLWTAFPPAFAAIMSTLFIPLSLAALGIVLRGSGFAFHRVARQESQPPPRRFVVRSLFAAHRSSWAPWSARSPPAGFRLAIRGGSGDKLAQRHRCRNRGLLFVATGAYLSAVFLVGDARRIGDRELENYFSARALWAALATGAIAVAAIFVYRSDARFIYDGLTSEGLPLVIGSLLCGVGVLGLLLRGERRGTRALAVGAVVAVVWGWGVAQYPYLLPKTVKIQQAAGAGQTLTAVLIVFVVAVLVVLPSLGLLYSLAQRTMIEEESEEALE